MQLISVLVLLAVAAFIGFQVYKMNTKKPGPNPYVGPEADPEVPACDPPKAD